MPVCLVKVSPASALQYYCVSLASAFRHQGQSGHGLIRHCPAIARSYCFEKITPLFPPPSPGLYHWGRRLEGLPNTAARLASWRRVTQQGVILLVMAGPCHLPWRTTPLVSVWGWSITKCTQNIVLSYVTHGRKACAGTLVDPCFLSGMYSIWGPLRGRGWGDTGGGGGWTKLYAFSQHNPA
jgi:hypothetical protein